VAAHDLRQSCSVWRATGSRVDHLGALAEILRTFRQKHLAEFTSDDEEAFIAMETVRGCMDNPPPFQGGSSATFVDWSTGGDETVIATAEGNRLRIAAAFRERDAVQVVRRVAHLLQTNSLLSSRIAADAGGIGGPMCAQLTSDFGIPVTRVSNGSPARKKEEFANADAEKWFAFRRLLEKREVILPVDGELLKQLSRRRLQYDHKARIQLEPKELMRTRGLSSPTGPMRSSVPPFRACPVLGQARSRRLTLTASNSAARICFLTRNRFCSTSKLRKL